MRHRRRAQARAAALFCCLVTTACGSTAIQGTQAQHGPAGLSVPGQDGLTAPGEDGLLAPGQAAVPGVAGEVVSGTASAGSRTTAGTAGEAPGSATGGPTPGVVTSGGGTEPASKRPVEVGIMYFTDANAFVGSFGSDADFGDPKVQAQRVVDDINRRGGLNGNKLVPVFHPVTLMDAEPYDSKLQAMCENWTRDHKVIAGLTIGNNATNIQACLEKAGVVSEQSGDYLHDADDYAAFRHMVNPGELQATVGAATYVDGLHAQGFFKPGDKIGVFYNDYPGSARAYEKGLKPALARHGLKVDYSYAAHFPESTAAIGSAVQEFQGPVLRAASENINKVLFLCTACAGVVMTYADSQGYRPTYGLSSWNQVNALAGSAPASQLAGSRGVGWAPLLDTGAADKANPGVKRCLAVMKEQAQTAAHQVSAFSYCDMLYSLEEAAELAPGALTSASLLAGLQQLGARHQSPFTLTTELTSSARWGVATARPMAFTADCSCFRYTGGPFRTAGR